MHELQRITEIVASVGQVTDISPDTTITQAGVDSIRMLTLLMELESAYDVSIPDDDFLQARTSSDLLALVIRLQQEQKQLCPA